MKASVAYQKIRAAVSRSALVASAALGKYFTLIKSFDAANVTDLITRVFGKGLQSAAATTDLAAKSVSKGAADAANASDLASKAPQKALTDAASSSETSFRSVIKAISDIATATDDFDSVATGDDQIINFTKSTSDQVVAQEVFQRVAQYVRQHSDSAVAAELAAKTILKSFTDSVLLTDEVDTSGVLYIPTSDNLSLADTIVFAVIRSIADSANASDLFQYSLARQFADSDVVSDSAVKSPQKLHADAASTQDAGSVRSQGYSSFDYFMEDYVGSSQTF